MMIKSKMENRILKAPFLQAIKDLTYEMWMLGWDERNGGNISLILDEKDLQSYLDLENVHRQIPLQFQVPELANQYFLVTGSGKYFRNMRKKPEESLGIIRIDETGTYGDLLWGFVDGSMPTSELPAHLMSHVIRLQEDPDHRVIIHTHATNLIAMTFTHALDEKEFTKTLWKMCTECIVVFPEGVAMLPWMIPGTDEIGKQTAEKMKDFRLVVWPHHGIFGAGTSIDDAFGLIETAEKAAEIYMLIHAHKGGVKQAITDEELVALAKAFGVQPNERFLR